MVAGARLGVGCEKGWSNTERGVDARVDMIDSTYARSSKVPPDHQLNRVSRLAACRMPTNASVEEAAPPKVAARPPPFPACKRTAATTTRLSRISRTTKNVNIAPGMKFST